MSGITVFGVTGRMGQSLIRALREAASAPASPDPSAVVQSSGSQVPAAGGGSLYLCGGVASASSRRLGRDAALEGPPTGVIVTADAPAALQGAAVAIDFSVSGCVADNARACVAAKVPLLVGATGFDAAARAALAQAAAYIPVLIASNTSLGVAVMTRLVKQAAMGLGAGYDVEILEAHHRQKRDAPSGTALSLGGAIADARGERLADVAVFDRHGASAARESGSIGFAVVRAGEIVGEHTVMFVAAGERLEITHRATDRTLFARGALHAAAWLVGRPAGLYGMENVIER